MKDLMIDIETMSSSSNAAMIQLAGVYFDRNTGETGEEFCKNVSLQDCLDCGFEKSEDTEKWWAEQRQDILHDILSNANPAEEVLKEFAEFASKAKFVWSHATFDFVIVQNYLIKFNLKRMPFRGAMDIRTLIELSRLDLDKYDWTKKTHNAMDDCKFQISYCVDAINKLKA